MMSIVFLAISITLSWQYFEEEIAYSIKDKEWIAAPQHGKTTKNSNGKDKDT